MYAGILTTPCSGTVVWLHSLKDARRNGQIALIAGAATVGRCAVQLLTDNSIISIRLCNLSLSSSFFCIKEAAGTGGLGVYATQDIEAGVRILAEPPLVSHARESGGHFGELVEAMSKPRQDAFYQLSDCWSTGPNSPQGIFDTNNFFIGDTEDKEGIFAVTSRFNHGCVKNCFHTWNSSLGVMTVHTDRDIKCGEELSVSYCNYRFVGWKARQESLRSKYNFSCHCEACKLTGTARSNSDGRRVKINELMTVMNDALAPTTFYSAAMAIEQLLEVFKQEGIDSPGHICYIEYVAYMACKLARKEREARVWLERALKHTLMAEGKDSEMVLYLAKLWVLPPGTQLTQSDRAVLDVQLLKIGWK